MKSQLKGSIVHEINKHLEVAFNEEDIIANKTCRVK